MKVGSRRGVVRPPSLTRKIGLVIPETLRCSYCKKNKRPEEFFLDRTKTRGYSQYCKECSKLRKRNPVHREKMRRYNLKYYRGITLEEFNHFYEQQGGLCAICSKPETSLNNLAKGVKQLAVDHDHKTQTVRGLLCTRCNTALGCLLENEGIALNLLSYIRERC